MTLSVTKRAQSWIAAASLSLLIATPAPAESVSAEPAPAEKTAWDELLDAMIGGKIHLQLRPRYEYANQNGLDPSNAVTMRTQIGYGTKPYRGISVFGEFENVVSVTNGKYWNGAEDRTGETIIADPQTTEVNQYYVKAQADEYWGLGLMGPRQVIILDDARFVGNVGWRQNEQTFDAVRFRTSLGIEDLELEYIYMWQVNRIWGDRKGPAGGPSRRDFDMSSHLIHAAYPGAEWANVSLFAYIMDYDGPFEANSSDTFGLRVTGTVPFDAFAGYYQASYAFQTSANDGSGPSYDAHYYVLDAGLRKPDLGGLGLGIEVLGSDDGKAVFATPLATAHKFNGWADAFLNNGGPRGLRDLYAYVTPKLPWNLQSRIAGHKFWSDDGGRDFGWEIDAQLSRKLHKYVTVPVKEALYRDGRSSESPGSRSRFWLQVTFEY